MSNLFISKNGDEVAVDAADVVGVLDISGTINLIVKTETDTVLVQGDRRLNDELWQMVSDLGRKLDNLIGATVKKHAIDGRYDVVKGEYTTAIKGGIERKRRLERIDELRDLLTVEHAVIIGRYAIVNNPPSDLSSEERELVELVRKELS